MANITLRNVKSLWSSIAFLTEDVEKNGGTATETVIMNGTIWKVVVGESPWGPIVIKEEADYLDFLSALYGE